MSNRLVSESSPYLRQHADNPVDWYPWGPEALERARREHKPVLLSVGYSSCHWCHVMAHESFEDPRIADLMNRHFINIKVDREERPDLDQIYQTAHYMLTGRPGGWPLNMALTPEGVPFFGGTYFPKSGRHGMPGFDELLAAVAGFYRERSGEIATQNQRLLEVFDQMLPRRQGDVTLDRTAIDQALEELRETFDPVHGGFGQAPKFPHAGEIELCLRAAAHGDAQAGQMARITLLRMAEGGLFDHLGGGFFRYSVDERWAIPHFEKMLYDNGSLLPVYADAWCLTGEARLEQAVRETVAWALREMRAPEGGFYATLDADSEGEEGKFYVWTREAVQSVLDTEEHWVASRVFGLDGPPNFEGHAWHLQEVVPLAKVAAGLAMPTERAASLLASARQKLFAAREARARPGCDTKILAAWNGLMIRGLARAGRIFDEPEWIHAASEAARFARRQLWRGDRLLASWKDGEAHLNAYLDDYAFLLQGLLELLQCGYDAEHLAFARDLAEGLLEDFEDREAGGFFFTRHDHERLVHRPKSGHDNATPSGNGVAASALLRLGHLLAEPRYLEAAERTLTLFLPQMAQHPSGFGALLLALADYLTPPAAVVLRGAADELLPWRRALARRYCPEWMVVPVPHGAQGLPAALDKPAREAPAAYLCRGGRCLPPAASLEELSGQLAAEGLASL